MCRKGALGGWKIAAAGRGEKLGKEIEGPESQVI